MARRDQRSPEAQAYRRLYKNARWRELRLRILARDLYTCRVCGRLEGRKGQMAVNHIRPHKGDEALFWDEANLAATCKACHDSAIQKQEKRGRVIGCDENGVPLDAGHHWRRA